MAGRLDDLVTKALVFRNMSAEKVWLQYGLYVGTRVLDIVLCIAFIAVAIGLINKAYIYKKDEMSVKEMVMLIIPSLVGVTGYGILQYYLMIYERDTGKNLIDTYGFYGALSFLHYLISIVAILIPLELKKHNTDPRAGILHLDCTFMPVGKGHAIIYKDGFMYPQDYHTLLDLFGRENVFEITREEMYYMNTNVFSISPEVVVSEKNFIRLNTFMEEVWGMTVERVPYYEISKMGGLLRCSTLPLIREND